MAYASHIINHFKKLRNVSNLIQHHGVLVRWLSNEAVSKRDDVFFLYAVVCVLAILFTIALVSEIKGRTLEEIQESIDN